MQTFEDVTFTSLDSVQPLAALLKNKFRLKKPCRILTGGLDILHIWSNELELLQQVQLNDRAKYDEVYCSTQLQDGRIAIGFSNGLVIIVNDHTLKIVAELRNDNRSIWTMAQLRNGLLVCGGDEGNLRLWNLHDKNGPTCTHKFPDNGNIRKVIQLRDGRLALSSFTYTVHLLQVVNQEIQSTGPKARILGSGYVRAMLQIDDNTLLTGGDEQNLVFYDLKTLNRTRQIAIYSTIWNFVPLDSGRILYCGSSGAVHSVNERGEDSITICEENKYSVNIAATNKYIVTGCNNVVIFFDHTGKKVKEQPNYVQYARVTMVLQ